MTLVDGMCAPTVTRRVPPIGPSAGEVAASATNVTTRDNSTNSDKTLSSTRADQGNPEVADKSHKMPSENSSGAHSHRNGNHP